MGIAPATEASKKAYICFFAKFIKTLPFVAINSLLAVITCFLLVNALQTNSYAHQYHQLIQLLRLHCYLHIIYFFVKIFLYLNNDCGSFQRKLKLNLN